MRCRRTTCATPRCGRSFICRSAAPALRVHLSNAFGTEALHFTSVHIARPLSPASPAIDPASDRPLTFAGSADVTVPPGAEFISDPLDFPFAPLSDLAVTFHLDSPPVRETGHPGRAQLPIMCMVTLSAPRTLTEPKHVDHWYQISEIDVQAAPGAAAVVALGDSITDGHGATTNGNDRWTDVLAARLQGSPATRNIGVSNQGIGGNHLLTDGLGPNALARFDRDVLAPAGVRWVIVFEGVNDLGRTGARWRSVRSSSMRRWCSGCSPRISRSLRAPMRTDCASMARRSRRMWGRITIIPARLSEADRQAVNHWIRAAGHFDAVIDFDGVVRDPQHPDRLLPAYDCGDHLHPSPAGYKAMGDAIPLSLFSQAN